MFYSEYLKVEAYEYAELQKQGIKPGPQLKMFSMDDIEKNADVIARYIVENYGSKEFKIKELIQLGFSDPRLPKLCKFGEYMGEGHLESKFSKTGIVQVFYPSQNRKFDGFEISFYRGNVEIAFEGGMTAYIPHASDDLKTEEDFISEATSGAPDDHITKYADILKSMPTALESQGMEEVKIEATPAESLEEVAAEPLEETPAATPKETRLARSYRNQMGAYNVESRKLFRVRNREYVDGMFMTMEFDEVFKGHAAPVTETPAAEPLEEVAAAPTETPAEFLEAEPLETPPAAPLTRADRIEAGRKIAAAPEVQEAATKMKAARTKLADLTTRLQALNRRAADGFGYLGKSWRRKRDAFNQTCANDRARADLEREARSIRATMKGANLKHAAAEAAARIEKKAGEEARAAGLAQYRAERIAALKPGDIVRDNWGTELTVARVNRKSITSYMGDRYSLDELRF